MHEERSEIVFAQPEPAERAAGGGGGGGPAERKDLHLFFIWVDPKDPCSRNEEEWPLPEKYKCNVQDWEQRYGCRAKVTDCVC